MTRIYIAARYPRRTELLFIASELLEMGYEITSNWLWNTGDHDPPGPAWQVPAIRDENDVRRADCLIAFTEDPEYPYIRGSRHVELGMALAWGKTVIICGPQENIFCWLPEVHVADDWEQLKLLIPTLLPVTPNPHRR